MAKQYLTRRLLQRKALSKSRLSSGSDNSNLSGLFARHGVNAMSKPGGQLQLSGTIARSAAENRRLTNRVMRKSSATPLSVSANAIAGNQSSNRYELAPVQALGPAPSVQRTPEQRTTFDINNLPNAAGPQTFQTPNLLTPSEFQETIDSFSGAAPEVQMRQNRAHTSSGNLARKTATTASAPQTSQTPNLLSPSDFQDVVNRFSETAVGTQAEQAQDTVGDITRKPAESQTQARSGFSRADYIKQRLQQRRNSSVSSDAKASLARKPAPSVPASPTPNTDDPAFQPSTALQRNVAAVATPPPVASVRPSEAQMRAHLAGNSQKSVADQISQRRLQRKQSNDSASQSTSKGKFSFQADRPSVSDQLKAKLARKKQEQTGVTASETPVQIIQPKRPPSGRVVSRREYVTPSLSNLIKNDAERAQAKSDNSQQAQRKTKSLDEDDSPSEPNQAAAAPNLELTPASAVQRAVSPRVDVLQPASAKHVPPTQQQSAQPQNVPTTEDRPAETLARTVQPDAQRSVPLDTNIQETQAFVSTPPVHEEHTNTFFDGQASGPVSPADSQSDPVQRLAKRRHETRKISTVRRPDASPAASLDTGAATNVINPKSIARTANESAPSIANVTSRIASEPSIANVTSRIASEPSIANVTSGIVSEPSATDVQRKAETQPSAFTADRVNQIDQVTRVAPQSANIDRSVQVASQPNKAVPASHGSETQVSETPIGTDAPLAARQSHQLDNTVQRIVQSQSEYASTAPLQRSDRAVHRFQANAVVVPSPVPVVQRAVAPEVSNDPQNVKPARPASSDLDALMRKAMSSSVKDKSATPAAVDMPLKRAAKSKPVTKEQSTDVQRKAETHTNDLIERSVDGENELARAAAVTTGEMPDTEISKVDLHQLAADILPMVKQLLAIEHERSF